MKSRLWIFGVIGAVICPYFTACTSEIEDENYTYRTYTTALGSNWNPHTWETNADRSLLSYISSPLVDISIEDSKEGKYQWVFEMATSVKDVTKNNAQDLLKYAVENVAGDSGYVYEIDLKRDAKFEDGTPITAESYVYSMEQLLHPKMKNYRANLFIAGESALAGAYDYYYQTKDKPISFDSVGLYAVDDYTLHYVCANAIDYNYFLTALTSSWLVHKDLYESCKRVDGDIITSTYGTSRATTKSFGPYILSGFEDGKQAKLERNKNWYGYSREGDKLVSYTPFLVDGKNVVQYEATHVVMDVLDEGSAKQAFLKGELSEWTPPADQLPTYNSSDKLYKMDDTYTLSLFFNCDLSNLRKMDESKGNINSKVLSNTRFRKALSLCVDRARFVTSTAGFKPTYALMNSLYYYDIFNNPQSNYRYSEQAMSAICNLYSVEYGEDKAYKTLKDAYNSITGYDLSAAKKYMKDAYQELTSSGIYKGGQPIKINIAWTKGGATSDDNALIQILEDSVNAAIVGSGFGKVTFSLVDNVADRYSAVPAGEYAIGYGAWGGAAFYPFRHFQVYMDPDQYNVNERACWNPKQETLTLMVDGRRVTKTWQNWSNCMIGEGEFAKANINTKLSITADLEKEYLLKYFRIPLCSSTNCIMLSHQVDYYTDNYNVMYDFGGNRLLRFKYNDGDWKRVVKEGLIY